MNLTKTYDVTDCVYHETIPNGNLKQGTFRANASISDEWHSIGTHSIKVDLGTGWGSYAIYTPTIKKGIVEIDYNSTNPITTVGVIAQIDGTERFVNARASNSNNTLRIPFDFSEYGGTYSRVEVRASRYDSSTLNPFYMDNIRIYPI